MQTLKKWGTLLAPKYTRVDIIMLVIYCHLEKENDKDLKFKLHNFSYFEIIASLL